MADASYLPTRYYDRGFRRACCGYCGHGDAIAFHPSKPDGTSRNLLDVRKIADMGWRPKINLRERLERYYAAFLADARAAYARGSGAIAKVNA